MWQYLLGLDKELLLWLNGDGGCFLDQFFYFASSKLTWIPLYIAILYMAWKRLGTRNFLWMLLCLGLAVGLADQICNFFKTYTPKFRPSHTPDIEHLVHTVRGYKGGLYGTVSAHSAISFTIAFFTSHLFRVRWYTLAIYGWALLVAYSRIYLGVHFPMDILLGGVLGTLLGWIAFRVFTKIQVQRRD